ncbi:O-acetylhomoserine aminocarboxypropyltransferase/cysteine synthase family protein [Deinococcus radiophilus]|uniref:Bifunctional O-acetylhomoserine aminocarboxypropyltransferase/cysteine synthase n=1 Tax=Deinococcus radiophilus TaxID=32062 RepID=A0A3S0L293_9DEIO|nr:aminotransferase class I/II-fold pyridoxal phosphate-dependent enzyme [Deinococcus radiophilus]RTR25280.1 bifunctional O-acetylhomoserine aminocarboxypropyltransferase/cysteine synthase [Deinococcus radiophilus]UFA51461.1 PLP-dependent transferase [Deinococcus radiophilus]
MTQIPPADTPHFETLQVHAGQQPDPATGSQAVPIYPTNSYVFESAEHAADLFGLRAFGNIYSRLTNPTNAVLEDRVAALEGGTAAVAVSSGHAAQFIAITNLAQAGDNIVSSPNLYGGTSNQFRVTLQRLGIEVRFTSREQRPEEFAALIDDRTRALYVETLGNPALNVPDFAGLAAVGHAHGVALVVDNTFGAGGYFCQPLRHGATVVVESLSKWIGGHGNGIGGIIVDGGNFDWGQGRYPLFSEGTPSYHGLKFWDTFGEGNPLGLPNVAFAIRARTEGLRDFGSTLAPQQAWQFIQGVQTLSLRAERQAQNALALAGWLQAQPGVSGVVYPGLPQHPSYQAAQKYLPRGAGSVLTFELEGGVDAGRGLIDALQLTEHVANVGDNRTLAIHPASTTHSQLNAEQQLTAGVTPGLVRVSLGIEHISDIQADFAGALRSL